jgi:pyridoxal phosphate enzyme (YggS family)
MAINMERYHELVHEFSAKQIQLVAVSKTKPVADINELYTLGQIDFGENYVQELVEKQGQLPGDIRWHFIGHLQTNKVKFIASFVHLIQSADSLKLLKEINKQAARHGRAIQCLLQIHIAEEDTKFGFDEGELESLIANGLSDLGQVQICGLMGMASFTEDKEKLRSEFKKLRTTFERFAKFHFSNFNLEILSMGMSSDYLIAIEEGSTMVRIGSALFGQRVYNK